MKYRVYTDPLFLKHFMGKEHLESPRRLEIIQEALASSDLDYQVIMSEETLRRERTRFQQLASKISFKHGFSSVSESLLERVHDKSLIDFVRESSIPEGVWVTPDTRTNEYTFPAAMLAAGAAITVANDARQGKPSIALVRPPGHHATRLAAMGFCFFNNIAIGAQSLLDQGMKRVMIIDIDNHYGNGTANVFYDSNQVLVWNIHADPRYAYPGVGFVNELGRREGQGYNVNVPLPIYTTDAEWLHGLETFLLPIIEEFRPQVVLVSLGLDALKGDPYGMLGLSPKAYAEAGRLIREALGKKKKIGVYLEGGYKYDELGEAFVSFFKGLNGDTSEYSPRLASTSEVPKLFSQYSGLLRKYWTAL